MPLYEYVCRECHAELELLVRGEEQPCCESCGGAKLEKLLSVASAHTAAGSAAASERPEGPCSSACGCFPQQ